MTEAEPTPSANRLTAKKQRLLAVAIFGALAAIAFSAVFVSERQTVKPVKTEATTFNLRPSSADREALIARYDAKLLALSRSVEKLSKEATERETALRAAIADKDKAIADIRRKQIAASDAGKPYLDEVGSRFGSKLEGPVRSAYRQMPDGQHGADAAGALPDTAGTSFPVPDGSGAQVPVRRLAMVTLAAPTGGNAAAAAGAAAAQSQAETPRKTLPQASLKPDDPLATNRASGTDVRSYLPAGSFVKGRLLAGVYAATGNGAASQPLPMLIRLEDVAHLPNLWKTDIRSCHLTASATGDLSSERVFIRLDRLSCVGKRGETLDVRVQGYAVGEDGKVGVRGRLVTRSGQAIASALTVGLLSGAGTAISRNSEQITTSITGTQTKAYTNAWGSGLGQGLSDAMDRIADYYLKLADRIFPVLEVNAGRKIDVVFSQAVLLSEPEGARK